MRAIAVVPGANGGAELADVEDPRRADGELLVDALALGICGTDREIVAGKYGWAPPGESRLVLGHESMGRVVEAPNGSGFNAGDLVAGMVRRPDPVPCPCCAAGEPDMCRNGRYLERGIKELHGYGSERWVIEPQYAVRLEPGLESVGMLVEPTSVVAKAWEQIERISARACLPLETVLITGAGPIGLLAALLATERGLDVHVLDQLKGGPKAALAEALGARYHSSSVAEVGGELGADIILECTGVGELVVDAMQQSAPGAIVCLTGVSPTGRSLSVDIGSLNNELVLENDVVFGSVNANRRHFEAAAAALARTDRDWLEAMVTRRLPLERWEDALDRGADDVKTVIQFGE